MGLDGSACHISILTLLLVDCTSGFHLHTGTFLGCESLNGRKMPTFPLLILSSGPSLFSWSTSPMVQINGYLEVFQLPADSMQLLLCWIVAHTGLLACGVRHVKHL